MNSNELRVWVSDALHDVVGSSDMTIADFLVGLAQKSTSSADLLQKIRDTETIDVDSKVTTFAQDLFDKVPKNAPMKMGDKRKAENRAREKAALDLAAKNKSFKLLDDEEDLQIVKPSKRKSKKQKSKQKSKQNASSEEDEDEFDKMERER